jgi:hypothetical protein
MKTKYKIISKNESLCNLINYFKSMNNEDIYYYINTSSKDIISFLESNIYDREDIELSNFVVNHIKIALNKFLRLNNDLFNIKYDNIKISYISDLIYFEDIFIIKDVIYINYLYIKRVFYDLEENNYSSMNDVYISHDNIYDKTLIKMLFKNLIFLSQNKNTDLWINKLENTFNLLEIIDINEFIINYPIIKNPSTLKINDKIFLFKINNKNYCTLKIIVSNKSYSPYYDNKIFEANKNNYNKYILTEIEENNEINNMIKINLFEDIAINMSNQIFNIFTEYIKKDEI